MAKIERMGGPGPRGGTVYVFNCPGCDEPHPFEVDTPNSSARMDLEFLRVVEGWPDVPTARLIFIEDSPRAPISAVLWLWPAWLLAIFLLVAGGW